MLKCKSGKQRCVVIKSALKNQILEIPRESRAVDVQSAKSDFERTARLWGDRLLETVHRA